jgi:hypothetical protein
VKIPILLKWVEEKNEWHLLTPTTKAFLYNIYNCANMQRLFDDPDKAKTEMYILDVYRFNKGDNNGKVKRK